MELALDLGPRPCIVRQPRTFPSPAAGLAVPEPPDRPVAHLLRYPLFAVLGRRVLDAWLGAAEQVRVQAGQTLFQAGTPGHHAARGHGLDVTLEQVAACTPLS